MRKSALIVIAVATACQTTPSTHPVTATVPAAPTPSYTPAPTPSRVPPTPSPTFAPAPRWFTEEFEVVSPHWVFRAAGGNPDSFLPEAGHGYLVMNVQAPSTWAFAIYDPHSYGDVRIDTRVEFGPRADGAAGVICRYDPDDGWYELSLYPDGTYAILFGQWLATDVVRYLPLVVDEVETIDDEANEIGFLCEGDVLTPYVNAVQLRSRVENRHLLGGGAVGISAASFLGSPLAVTFDRVTVAAP